MKIKYAWSIHGMNAVGNSWETFGTIDTVPGDFHEMLENIQKESFFQLTEGKATFGHPGKGCAGPYSIERLVVQKLEDIADA